MTDLTKPEIEFIPGSPPTVLEVTDLVVGDGPEAKRGDVVDVHYVGVDFESGEEFDSSWSRGESIEFPLAGLIRAWQEGIPGMKVGGRRQLVCPPELAYGPPRRRPPALGSHARLRDRPARRPLIPGAFPVAVSTRRACSTTPRECKPPQGTAAGDPRRPAGAAPRARLP